MKTHKLFISIISLGLLLGLLELSSCSKDSAPSVSPAQAKQTFSSVNTDLASDVGGLNTAPGNVALASFSTLAGTTSPFGRIRSFSKPGDVKSAISAGITSVRNMIMKGSGSERVEANTPFDFNSKKGVYVYNFTSKTFTKSQASSDIIKIDYPKDANSTTNDAELQITAYTDTSTPQGYQPTLIQAAIYLPIGGTKQAELKLTAGYDATGTENVASIDLFVNPYTISFSFDDSKTASASESFSFSKGSKLLIGAAFTATYASAADKTNGKNPSAVTGYVQLVNVRFNAAVDGTKAATAQSNNDFIIINVTVDGGKAGHIVWVTDQYGDQQPYIQYNDSSKELLETVFANLKTQLNALGLG